MTRPRPRRKHLRLVVSTVVVMVAAMVAPAVTARTINGVTFRSTQTVGDTDLRLVGAGLQRYMVVYKVCVAGFYLPDGVPASNALTDVAKRLEIEYFHKIRGDQFADMTTTGVKRNTSPAVFVRIAEDLRKLNETYEDVKPGDRYSLTYVPSRGMTLALNGVPKATFPGAAFAEAVFSVWLGDRPLNDGLKDDLLGN